MTEDKVPLQELTGKSADADFLHNLLCFTAQRSMEIDTKNLYIPYFGGLKSGAAAAKRFRHSGERVAIFSSGRSAPKS